MRRDKKGMTMALGVIIAIVVLIVVALAVIAITSGSLANFFGITGTQTKQAALEMKCTNWFTSWCLNNPGQSEPTDYPEYTQEEITVDCSESLAGRTCGVVATGTGT